MADGTAAQMAGYIDRFTFRSGKERFVEPVYIFPGLCRDMILGIPWLQKHNPKIDWSQGHIFVQKAGIRTALPMKKGERVNTAGEIQICSIREIQQICEEDSASKLAMIVVKAVPADDEVEKIVREDMSAEEKTLLRRYGDVMSSDLPASDVPVRKDVHEFRIELQEGTQPTNRCLLYTSPSPRDRQKSRMPSSA